MGYPKAHNVLLADGTEGRAVKFSARNNLTVLNWVPGAEYREQVSKKGQISNQRLMVPLNGSKRIKAAYFDDWIVKTEHGFFVVKFDKVEDILFFPDGFEERKVKRAYNAWKKSLNDE